MIAPMTAWRIPLALAATLAGAGTAPAQPVPAQPVPADSGAIAAAVVAKAPPAPDYSRQASWSVFASRGFASALPDGAGPAAGSARVAVFFLHPTTYRGGAGQATQDPADPAASTWTDESSVARQASAFTGCCSVYVPRYRAASYGVFASPALREAAFALAYSDVDRAFTAFLAAIGNRPFIIAGHSQGAFHAATLLERRIDGTPLQRRLVAAYTVGINLAEGEFGKRFHAIGPCRRPDQTGCVVQWNSYLRDGTDLARMAGLAQAGYVQKYGSDAGKETLCINPLTFDAARPAAGADVARGAVPGDPGSGPLRPLRAKAVAASCEQGLLVVTPDPALALKPLPGGIMHYHDIGLFWADLRANAMLRAARFRHGAR